MQKLGYLLSTRVPLDTPIYFNNNDLFFNVLRQSDF